MRFKKKKGKKQKKIPKTFILVLTEWSKESNHQIPELVIIELTFIYLLWYYGFELRASCLLCRFSATLPALFCVGYF
jgi:hypothetical protein